MFKSLRKLFSARRTGPWFKNRKDSDDSQGPTSVRRWDAAVTNRLNKAHWGKVTGGTLNVDLSSYLETLRTRVEYELANNSDAEGAVNTHITDVIGEDGPTLQVQSDSEKYNEELEKAWANWWAKPDVNARLSGVDILQLWLRSLWSGGEYLAQIIVDNDAAEPIKQRLLCLHARRLYTPADQIAESDVYMGVKRDKLGKPLEYYINAPTEGVSAETLSGKYDTLEAADIIHEFKVLEPGQVRGMPWLVTGLQAIADLRDYDNEVLDAARAAADNGVLLHTDHHDAQYVEVNETTELERRMMTTLPPGWKSTQMVPQQPSTRYVEYHDEQLRKVGRPVGMPLMMIKLDSGKHNYSSARFDGQIYQRAIASLRAWFVRTTLNRLVDVIANELTKGKKLPEKPAEVKYHWNWPPFPHVDPAKESKAATERLRNTTSTLRDECEGDWEELLEQQAREQAKREELGLPPLPEMLGAKAEPEAPEEPGEEKKGDEKED